MTIPTNRTLREHLDAVRQTTARLKRTVPPTTAALDAGRAPGNMLRDRLADMLSAIDQVAQARAASGFALYAQQQLGAPLWDADSDLAALEGACAAARDSIVALGSATDEYGPDGRTVQKTYSTATTGTLKADLDAILALIG